MKDNTRQFTGVWIPRHIIEDEELNIYEKYVWAEISCFEECYLSNETLSIRMGCSEDTVSRSVKKLKEKGYIELVSFDGRNRRLRCKHDLPTLVAVADTAISGTRIHIDNKEKDTENEFSESVTIQAINDEGEELVKYGGITDLKKKPPYPFSWKRELRSLQIAPQKVAKIVAHYVARKELTFDTYEQWYPEKARLLKEAVPLKGYSGKEIDHAMDYCQQKWKDDWKLAAVVKNISIARKSI